MSAIRTLCPTCGHAHFWSWDEAFDKFGFQDGDGLVLTEIVARALRSHGYDVTVVPWGFHNTIITNIARDGASVMPADVTRGYDHPRDYLPPELVALLDAEFPDGSKMDSS